MAFSDAITNGAAFRRFLRLASSRRVAVACINDSLGGQITEANSGFIRYLQLAFNHSVGIWGSTIYPSNALPEWALTHTPRCFMAGSRGLTDAPAGLMNIAFPNTTNGVPRGAAWWPANGFTNSTAGETYGIFQNHPLDKYRSLAGCTRLYKEAAGDITIYPNLTGGNQTPISGQVRTPVTVTFAAGGTQTYRHKFAEGSVVDLADPADATTHFGSAYIVSFREQFADGDTGHHTGGFGILYRWLEDYDMFWGVQVNILYQQSSMGSFNAAADLCNACPDAAIAEYFKTIASAQIDSNGNQLPPVLCVMCGMGTNDAAQSGAAIQYAKGDGYGAGAATGSNSNTQAGYQQNTQSWINRLYDIWVDECGYSASNLFIHLYTPTSDSASATRYAFYRTLDDAAAALIADSQNSSLGGISYCHGLRILFDKEIKQQANVQSTASPSTSAAVYGWRSPPATDISHMNDWAYEAYVTRMFSGLINAAGGMGTFASISRPIVSARQRF